jgi:aldose 1-epimerase
VIDYATAETRMRCETFGRTAEGAEVELYALRNRSGMEATITNYGGIVTALRVPDRHGDFEDVVLGFDRLEGYLQNPPYFGALIGRYANRIAGGSFFLDGACHQLATNDGPNALHGGKQGFDKVVWTVGRFGDTPRGSELELKYLSRDGEEGYPGNLSVTALYTLSEDNALRLDFTAMTDRPTIVNLTQHSYFNLRGRGDVLAHEISIGADRFTPVDAALIPTGEIRSVAGTPFDFRQPMQIGARIHDPDEQLRFGKGYDHNWVANGEPGTLRRMCTVHEPQSGRVLELLATQPGLQFYSGNLLDGTIEGKNRCRYAARSGFCMEPQHFPDTPHHSHFPSAVLRPGEVYRHAIVYRFSTRRRAD